MPVQTFLGGRGERSAGCRKRRLLAAVALLAALAVCPLAVNGPTVSVSAAVDHVMLAYFLPPSNCVSSLTFG